ncbi:MAG: hypothetical protein ACIWVG_21400 [Gloeotrichia echinulata HAB0833]
MNQQYPDWQTVLSLSNWNDSSSNQADIPKSSRTWLWDIFSLMRKVNKLSRSLFVNLVDGEF